MLYLFRSLWPQATLSQFTQGLNKRENTSLLINIVKRSLLRLYQRGPSRAGIAETGRQVLYFTFTLLSVYSWQNNMGHIP